MSLPPSAYKFDTNKAAVVAGTGFSSCLLTVLAVMTFNILVGGFCVDYVLNTAFGIDIPWYGDAAIGLFAGEIALPAAIITWILHFFVSMPFC